MEKGFKPTESELEILNVLWEKQPATVREVHEVVALRKDCGYTTTLKLMQIMHDKGLVSRDESGKTHWYLPLVSREQTQQHMVGKMMNDLFAGSAGQLVMQVLGATRPSNEELDEIEKMIRLLKK